MSSRPYLTLGNQGLLRSVGKFHWILNGDYVFFSGTVDLIHNGIKGGRFTTASWTGYQE